MTTIVDAVYERGLFRPVEKVQLTEGTRVQVRIVQPAGWRDPKAVARRFAEIAAKIPPGPRETTSRDHDQILYGGKEQP